MKIIINSNELRGKKDLLVLNIGSINNFIEDLTSCEDIGPSSFQGLFFSDSLSI